jgi:hypothetical protein
MNFDNYSNTTVIAHSGDNRLTMVSVPIANTIFYVLSIFNWNSYMFKESAIFFNFSEATDSFNNDGDAHT